MGEIATWSAVKTKVGLGKDSNECPTKAELLALSPTGTGENYVGLEISNASSYGNNETVQLSDIHKVTYKYRFTVDRTTLSFPASGGAPSPNLWFGLVSRKQKYVDGVISGSYTEVGSTQTAYPDWVSYNQTVPQYEAKENTELVERSANMTYTQNESGKQITVQFTQAVATSTWAYTFTLTKASSNSIGALGGKVTFEIDSYKQEIRNGHNYGSQIPVSYKRTDDPDSSEILEMTIPENKTESSRGFNYIWTQDESNKKQNYTVTQAAGVKTYGTPTVYLGNIADIPASGGTAATPTYTYSQLWGWNGKTNDGGTISSGASVVGSENISGSNLGTTAKARTKLGSRTLTVTLNGKSGSASIDVYQAENKITNVTQGAWVVSISANPSTFTEQGGTSQISASARAPRTNHWSSGATNAASDAIGTPTLSIPIPSTGFSLSGTTLTVAENTTANERSVVVRATMGTVYKEVTVTQSVYLVEWKYTFSITPLTLNFDALGAEQQLTITSYREKYINGSIVSGSRENVEVTETKDSFINTYITTGKCTVSMGENTVASSRVGHINFFQTGSDQAAIEVTCNQSAAIISESWVLREISGFGTIPAVGGQVYAIVESGYYDVINGTQGTWHNEAPEVSNNPGWISLTSVQYNNDNTYTIKATGISNSDASGRSGKIFINNHPKSLGLDIVQSGASISYNYYFSLVSDFPSVATAGATPRAKVLSKSKEVINGTESSSYGIPQITVQSKPDWVGNIEAKVCGHANAEETLDITAVVSENKTSSIRRGTIIIKQNNSHKTLTLNINQAAASITYQYTFEITDPSSKVINVPAKPIDPEPFSVSSFKTKVVNGTVTSETTRVGVTVDTPDENWLKVSVGSMGEGEVTCENNVGSIRSATVTIRQEESGNLDQIDINQAATDIKVTYDLRWALSDGGSTPEDHVNEYSLGTGGEANRLRLFLLCDKITKIGTEEISRTPVQTGLSNLTTFGPVYTDIDGEPSPIIQDDGGQNILPALFPELKDYSNCYNILIGSIQNLGLVQEAISMTFNKPVMDGTTQIGKVPTFLFYVDAVPYSREMEYQFRGTGSSGAGSIYNVTVPASDGTGYFSIISFRAYIRNGVEFKREYLEPTFTAPTDVTIIKNGQNSDNSYDYALKVTDNLGEIERQWDIPFVNPITGSQIHLYLTQESPHTPEVAFDVYSSSLHASLLMGIGWRSNEGSDSLPNLSSGEYLGAHGSNKSNIQVVYHAQPITTSQQWLLATPSLKGFSYDGLPIALNGTDRYYNISEFQYGSSSASELFKVTVGNIDYDQTYGGSLTLRWEARLSNNKPTNGMYVGMIVLTPVRGNLPAIYVGLYYQSPSVKPSV